MTRDFTDAIPLSTAAALAYQQIFSTRRNRNIAPSIDELDLVALALSTHIPIYGLRETDQARSTISDAELMQGMFRGGATRFEFNHGDTTLTRLTVRKTDLEVVLGQLKREPPPTS